MDFKSEHLSIASVESSSQASRKSTGPISARDTSLGGVIERFETLQRRTNSPVAAIRRRPARDARYEEMPRSIDPRLRKALAARGIEKLYLHQARSWDRISAKENVVVVTPDRQRQDALLQPAGPERACCGPVGVRPLPLSDQGPGRGPAA